MNTMKTLWNLTMLYQSPKDPNISKDIQIIAAACQTFEKKWKKRTDYLLDEKILQIALDDYSHLCELLSVNKPVAYFYLLSDIDTENKIAKSELSRIEQELTLQYNKILFFELELGSITKPIQKKILANKNLGTYHYFLKKIFSRAKYQLSEPEEKLSNLFTPAKYTLWVDGVEKDLSEKKISWKGEIIGLGQAAVVMPTLPRKERIVLHELMKSKMKEVAAFAESELNAIVTAKKVSDTLRGYRHSYSETIQKYENEESSILNFIQIVTSHFPTAHQFYAIRKKMLKIDDVMGYVDISAEAGTIHASFDFESAAGIVKRSFTKVDPDFSVIFDRFLENGQIDVFPRVGKRSGAYCASFTGLPTFVLLNHISSFDSVKTLAHEMGHAIHSEYSKSNHILYEHYTTSTAEVASTLFENFAFEEMFLTLSENEKIIALHNKIMDNVATIFRQIAFINFEIELHSMIRAEGFVSRDKISNLMIKHLKSYLGPKFKFDPDDGLFWIRLSHLRSFFYMYTYAYGQLISNAMYARYKTEPSFVSKIKQFLSAGGSDTPENIFKSIGIDTTKEEFWVAGLSLIKNDVAMLQKLITKKMKKK